MNKGPLSKVRGDWIYWHSEDMMVTFNDNKPKETNKIEAGEMNKWQDDELFQLFM